MTRGGAGSWKRWAIVRRLPEGGFQLHRLFENEVASAVPDSELGTKGFERGEGPLVEVTRDGLTVETMRGELWEPNCRTSSDEELKALRKRCSQMESFPAVMDS